MPSDPPAESLSHETTLARVAAAIDARADFFAPPHDRAFRLFSGVAEGHPPLSLDVYARTLVVHDHAEGGDGDEALVRAALALVRERLPWLRAALWKARKAAEPEARRGRLLFGSPGEVDRRVREDGVRYALALDAFRDASFYLDTRGLRAWAKRELVGASVFNAFAHTGSLGIAARAAPASLVVHVDKSRPALNLAKDSYALNGFEVRRADFRTADFFVETARLRREGALFDCAFLDPPFFSTAASGRVDLERDFAALVDKVRPIVGDGGRLVAVNNALYVSGAEYERTLASLASDGYLELEARLPVPDDVTGLSRPGPAHLPTDPSPYNHPTKIAILRVKRRDGRKASGLDGSFESLQRLRRSPGGSFESLQRLQHSPGGSFELPQRLRHSPGDSSEPSQRSRNPLGDPFESIQRSRHDLATHLSRSKNLGTIWRLIWVDPEVSTRSGDSFESIQRFTHSSGGSNESPMGGERPSRAPNGSTEHLRWPALIPLHCRLITSPDMNRCKLMPWRSAEAPCVAASLAC